ncbi:hypothetical protein BT69DRAFT_788858 [Atractiella rhizophila]|nr:hypothetical protein BT69DRAFT_788858 [Atractiella rhizophila]
MRLSSTLFDGQLIRTWERRGREAKLMGKYGEVLIATLLAGGAKSSGHPSILRMSAPTAPNLVGDMVIYSIARKQSCKYLEERAGRMFEESGVLTKDSDYETLVVLLEVLTLMQRSGKQKQAAQLHKTAITHFRKLQKEKPSNVEPSSLTERLLLRHISFAVLVADSTLSRNLRNPQHLTEDDIQYAITSIDPTLTPRFTVSADGIMHTPPSFESPHWQEIAVVGGLTFLRSHTTLLQKALNTKDQGEAAPLFETALGWVGWRKRWVEEHMGYVKGEEKRCMLGLERSVWIFNEETEFPILVFSGYSHLREYLDKLEGDEGVHPELARVSLAYEMLVERTIEQVLEKLKRNLLVSFFANLDPV